jgi:RNA polymerase sigma-70 factor (ECF subfamily)
MVDLVLLLARLLPGAGRFNRLKPAGRPAGFHTAAPDLARLLLSTAYDDGYEGRARRPAPRRPEYDEARLLAAAQRGELPAFNQLVLHYQGLAFNVAYRVTGDDELAADAVQDAFVKAYQRLAQYRGGSFKAWLLRIVTNTCYDALRARKRRPTTPLETGEDEDDESEYDARLIDGGERPDAFVMRKELAAVIQVAIGQLPADQRTALVLADVEGLDYQEIADATGAALGTVKSRLSRARAKVRDLLLEHQELLPAQYRHSDS